MSGTDAYPIDELATTTSYQPDITQIEAEAAIAFVRSRVETDFGHGAASAPDFRAIFAYPPDAPFYVHRVVYVSAHDSAGEPVYGAWVDLTERRIAKFWGDPTATAPSTRSLHPAQDEIISAAASITPTVSLLPSPLTDSISWGGWSFSFRQNAVAEGLLLRRVTFDGHLLADKLSFPVMLVRYANNLCGPYADRIEEPADDIPWANNQQLAYREWSIDGKVWRELGIRKVIGDYDLFQSYVFSPTGVMEARLAGSGLQCPADHVHWPTWFINFDLDGGWNDRVVNGTTGASLTTEQDVADDGTWRVEDRETGTAVDLSPALLPLNSPGDGIDSTLTDRSIGARRYNFNNDVGWTLGAAAGFPNLDGESLLSGDVSTWYRARMSHAAADGASHWHTSGVRLTVHLGSSPSDGPLLATRSAASATQSAVRGPQRTT